MFVEMGILLPRHGELCHLCILDLVERVATDDDAEGHHSTGCETELG